MPGSEELAALQVERVTRADVDQVVDVLCESFRDYPVMRFVLADEGDYDARLRRMIGLFVTARVLLDDAILGIRSGTELIAVATTSDPARPPHPEWVALRDTVWRELGNDAAVRYQQCVTTWQSLESHVPQLHVNMLGVRRSHQGTGLGRELLVAAHQLAETRADWQGVSLTTEVPANVRFYEHRGYVVIGTAAITPGITTWSLMRWKPNSGNFGTA